MSLARGRTVELEVWRCDVGEGVGSQARQCGRALTAEGAAEAGRKLLMPDMNHGWTRMNTDAEQCSAAEKKLAARRRRSALAQEPHGS